MSIISNNESYTSFLACNQLSLEESSDPIFSATEESTPTSENSDVVLIDDDMLVLQSDEFINISLRQIQEQLESASIKLNKITTKIYNIENQHNKLLKLIQNLKNQEKLHTTHHLHNELQIQLIEEKISKLMTKRSTYVSKSHVLIEEIRLIHKQIENIYTNLSNRKKLKGKIKHKIFSILNATVNSLSFVQAIKKWPQLGSIKQILKKKNSLNEQIHNMKIFVEDYEKLINEKQAEINLDHFHEKIEREKNNLMMLHVEKSLSTNPEEIEKIDQLIAEADCTIRDYTETIKQNALELADLKHKQLICEKKLETLESELHELKRELSNCFDTVISKVGYESLHRLYDVAEASSRVALIATQLLTALYVTEQVMKPLESVTHVCDSILPVFSVVFGSIDVLNRCLILAFC